MAEKIVGDHPGPALVSKLHAVSNSSLERDAAFTVIVAEVPECRTLVMARSQKLFREGPPSRSGCPLGFQGNDLCALRCSCAYHSPRIGPR